MLRNKKSPPVKDENDYHLENLRHEKWGYSADVVWTFDPGRHKLDPPVRYRGAFNPFGDYIGTPKDARFLHGRGIEPITLPGNTVCSIGYSSTEKKWYGWSHRAICGFKPGSKVKNASIFEDKFPIGFIAQSNEDAKQMAAAFARGVS